MTHAEVGQQASLKADHALNANDFASLVAANEEMFLAPVLAAA